MGLSSPIHLLQVFDTCCTVSWRSVGPDTIAPKVRKSPKVPKSPKNPKAQTVDPSHAGGLALCRLQHQLGPRLAKKLSNF